MGVNKIFCIDNLLAEFIHTLILTDGECRPAGFRCFAGQEVEPGFAVETHLNTAAGFMRHLSTSRKSLGSDRKADEPQVLKTFWLERLAENVQQKVGLKPDLFMNIMNDLTFKPHLKLEIKKFWLSSPTPIYITC